ncbi:MAG: TonB family protein [Proteobacteria bacterium]|nr:TonB family protein [Pseudomonadota bacterium]
MKNRNNAGFALFALLFASGGCAGTDLKNPGISELVDGVEKDFKKPYELCQKTVQSELVKIQERFLDSLRSKTEQDQKRARFERMSLNRAGAAICISRVFQYLDKYNLKINDLSQKANREVGEIFALSSEIFYSNSGYVPLGGALPSVAFPEKYQSIYFDIIDKPPGVCDPIDLAIRGISVYLLNRSGGACDSEAARMEPAGKGGVPNKSAGPAATFVPDKSTAEITTPASDPAAIATRQPLIVSAGLRPGSPQPDSKKFITARVRKLKLSGAVIVKACVDKNGNFSSATIVESGGDIDLDTSAIKYARTLIYAPATIDGNPVEGCFQFRARTTFQ